MLPWPPCISLYILVGQGHLVLTTDKLLLLQFNCFWACTGFQGHLGCFVLVVSSPVKFIDSMCVWCFSPDQIIMQWEMNSWGSISSAMLVVNISTVFLQALKLLCSWLSSVQFSPLSGCLVPSWSLCGYGYAVHLFTSHQTETESSDRNLTVRCLPSLWLNAWMTLSSKDTHKG